MPSPSPLRYPGGKFKLYPYMEKIITQNELQHCTYIEPFAGGCGLALSLLQNNLVNRIIINDYDYAVYAFWYSIINHTEDFCNKINEVKVDIYEWDLQKEIYLNQNMHTIFDVGFSAFFLNRTNRSGIINGGIIGGRNQEGHYTIDCRFNKPALIKKIRRIATDADRIEIYNFDVLDLIDRVIIDLPVENTFIYFDPPYVKKGPKLYKNHFNFQDHVTLHNKIVNNLTHKWLITYDHIDEISILYQQYKQDVIDINYSAGTNKQGRELAIFCDDLLLPE